VPDVSRDGDTWVFTFDEHGIGVGVERLIERSGSLKAEITVESKLAGRVQGPNVVDLLSSRSLVEFGNACHKRVNGLSAEVWASIVVACAGRVSRDYREPPEMVHLDDVEDTGPVPCIVPLMLPTSETTVIYGDGESCKSLLAVRIGFSIATGQDVPWGHEVQPGNVLYLDWETNKQTVASRLRRVANAMHMPVPHNFMYQQCLRSLADELPNIRERISKHRISLVIVDSLGFAANGSLVEDETARSAMNALRQMSPATRLAVTHISKGSAESTGPAKPFGSAFFWNGMRSGIEVRRSEDTAADNVIDVGVYHRKKNDGRKLRPLGLSVIFDEENPSILFEETDLVDVPDLAARTPLSGRIRDALRAGSMTTRQLADDLDAKEDSIKKTLNRMRGQVVQIHGGKGRGNIGEWGLAGDI
jgi:hypothetical protein